MTHPFQIEFEIFDKTKSLNDKQLSIRNELVYGIAMKNIIKKVVTLIDDKQFKLLDRHEAAISSVDEQKQLRLSNHCSRTARYHSIYFHQKHSGSKMNFTEGELLVIVKAMTHCLEGFLGYSICVPKLSIDLNDLETIVESKETHLLHET
jgi:hypothetical protein